MQLLVPPEKVRLYRGISVRGTGEGHSSAVLRTGYRKPQQVIQVFRSSQAIVPVEIHRHLVPRGPCSCET